MPNSQDWFEFAMGLGLVAPFLASMLLGALLLLRPDAQPERAVVRITLVSLSASFIGGVLAATIAATHTLPPIVARLTWFSVGHYEFSLGLLTDAPALIMMVLVPTVIGLIGRFSVNYLHRDPGFVRFFLLLNLFSFGMLLLVSSASVDQLYLGWEIVGLTSSLLVSYFHLRRTPVLASIRVFTTYRLCDIGLLFGAALMHRYAYGTDFVAQTATGSHLHPAWMSSGEVTAIGLCLTLGAIGKAAQLPMGGWLPRAMEGPTPSSALFYGALSVHAGVFLLIRAYPLLEAAPLVAAVVVAIGALTATYASLVVRAQSDAKNGLAFATMAQVGLMFVAVGLGFTRFAMLHMVAHVCLRAYQFLRTPSALRDAVATRAALGSERLQRLTHRDAEAEVPHGLVRIWLYRIAVERFYIDTLQQFLVVDPLVKVGRALSALEHALLDFVAGKGDEHDSSPLQHPPHLHHIGGRR